MKNPAQHLVRFAVASFLGGASASAATLTVTSTGDSYIRSTSATSNFNNSQLLLTGDTITTNDAIRAALSFNLNDPALLGATINSVTLKIFIETKDVTSSSTSETLQIFQLTRGFTETQVTWNIAATGTNWTTAGGDFSSTLLSSVSANPSTVTAGQEFDFLSSTDFVNSVSSTVAGSDKTLSLLLKLANTDTTRSIFRFYAGTTSGAGLAAAGLRPQLVIDYTAAPIPEPSSFAAFAALGALGFASSRRRRA